MSTLQVDRITPYQSASVQIDGDVTYTGAVSTGSFNTYTASQEALNTTFATTGSNTFIGNQVVTGTDKQTFNEPGDNQEVRTISVNSFVDSQGYTMGINTFGWYHYNSEGHEGFSSNLWTNDYAYGGAWFHDPDKFEYILFPSGAAYDSNVFGLYDNGDTTTKFRVLTDKIELTGSAELSGSQTITGDLNVQTGTINGRDILLDDPGATTSLFLNPNFNSEFIGIANRWFEGTNKAETVWAEETAQLLLNGWSGSAYDNALFLTVDGNGATFADWDGSYTTTPWLNVPKQGSVNFKRALKLEAQDPLPAGALGELSVSGSALYFHDGSSWRQVSLV